MSRVGALDCGTNSLRLLIAEPDGDGGLHELVRRTEIVRLGAGVDRTGRLDEAALERTRLVLDAYRLLLDQHDVTPAATRLVATSATRDASNRSDFQAMVRAAIGVEPDVVSGADEAELSFAGAVRELRAHPTLTSPYLVVDIGGGSTELVLGVHAAEHARSVDIGCVRLTERHLRGQREAAPGRDSVAALVADVDAALDLVEQSVPLREAHSVICVAGTATTIAALSLGLTSYQPRVIHHAHIPTTEVIAITDRLVASTVSEVAALPPVHPGRADVLTAGALTLRTVLQRVGAGGYTASEHDILDGIAWSVIDEQV